MIRLLAVEDEKNVAGYLVAGGDGGLAMAPNEAYDLILDVNLPSMDGLGVLQELRNLYYVQAAIS